MRQILVQLDEQTLALLDRYAPGRSRKRSEFIRRAVVKALLEVCELQTERGYKSSPMPAHDAPFDPADWAPETHAIHPSPKRRAGVTRRDRRR